MKRSSSVLFCIAIFGCAAAHAQEVADLTTLEQTAQKRNVEWETLAKDLSDRMARILPCDPRSTAALADVSRASEARLAALADYLRAVLGKAFAETAAATNLLAAKDKRAMEAGLERADAGREETAVALQSDRLMESAKQRPSLEAPQKVLQQIVAMIHQRAAASEQQARTAETAVQSLRDLVMKFEARDAALREEFAAFESERARWNGYYAARRARAQIECSITQIGPSPAPSPAKSPSQPKGKQ